jgi:hypothetical protein
VASADKPKDKADLASVDLQAEFHRYLIQRLQKKTKLQVIDLGTAVTLPSRDLVALSRAGEFWRSVGQQHGADIVVSGSLEFKIEDSAGYKTEEYVSPVTGQTSFRQIYIERTGFLFDIVFLVFDGKTGDRLLQDEFKFPGTQPAEDRRNAGIVPESFRPRGPDLEHVRAAPARGAALSLQPVTR